MSEWTIKGGTFSDKTARKEFDITQEEIIEGIENEKLQYRVNYMHGNPYYRLLRSEVEALVNEKYGEDHLAKKKLKNELAQVNSRLRKLKSEMKKLEKRKIKLSEMLGN